MSGDRWPDHGVIQAREINLMMIPHMRSGGPKPPPEPQPGTHVASPLSDTRAEYDVNLPEEVVQRMEVALESNRRVLWAIFWTGFLGTGALVWIGVELHAERLAKERLATTMELPKEEKPDALDHR